MVNAQQISPIVSIYIPLDGGIHADSIKNDMETIDTERVATTKISVTILLALLHRYLS